MFTAAVVTVSDRCFDGWREDLSGPDVCLMLEAADYRVDYTVTIPDEQEIIELELIKCADEFDIALIITIGGTGFSPRDITPEATRDVIHREVPGIPEAMRQESLKITRMAMLTRAIAGIRSRTLIINMPGSLKAAQECFEVIRPALPHAMEILTGRGGNCGG